jgi:hypothetical protein
LEYLENRTLPSFLTAADFATGPGPNAFALADFNHDGHLDIVTANSATGSNTVSVLLGNGNGSFQAARTFNAGPNPVAVAVGDLNSDGTPDIVVVNNGNNTVSVVLIGSGGTYVVHSYSVGTNPDAVALGDFNGDGKLDIAVADAGAPPPGGPPAVSVLLGNGNGTFAASTTLIFPPGAGSASAIAAADFNGDGKLDLVTTNNGPGPNVVSVFVGNGNGTFRAPIAYATGTNPTAVAVADFNGDGKLDLVTANNGPGPNNVSLLLGNGDGSFGVASNFSAGGGALSLTVSDVNGDGRPDVITANGGFANNSISVLLNNGGGTFAAPQLLVADQNPVAVAVGSFTANGKLDLVVANHNSNDVSFLFGEGNGAFVASQTYDVAGGAGAGAVVAGDFNGDGWADLVVANTTVNPGGPPPPPGALTLLVNRRDGTFRATPPITLGAPVADLVAGDFNGDGKIDLAVSTSDSQQHPVVMVFLGNGNGSFQAPIVSPAGLGIGNMTVGDFNGDGKADLVGVNGPNSTVTVLLGNGNGTFGPATTYAVGTNPDALVVGDFNHDGKLDVAVADVGAPPPGAPPAVSILLGNGNGTFAAASTLNYPPGSGTPTSIAVGDFNGDGKLDLVTPNNGPGPNSVFVFLGNGNGSFANPVGYGVGSNPVNVVVADVTGDGIPDLVVVSNGSDTVSVLPGIGNGTFAPPLSYAVGDGPAAVAVADLNRDGQLDLAVTNGNAGSITGVLTAVKTVFALSAPTGVVTGSQFNLTVTAENSTGGTLTNFAGTIHFSSSDLNAGLPVDYTFVAGDHGVHTFAHVVLRTPGLQSISVNGSPSDFAGSTLVGVTPGATGPLSTAARAGSSSMSGGAASLPSSIGTAGENAAQPGIGDLASAAASGCDATSTLGDSLEGGFVPKSEASPDPLAVDAVFVSAGSME